MVYEISESKVGSLEQISRITPNFSQQKQLIKKTLRININSKNMIGYCTA
jgi:hypothetical protein